MNMKYSLIWKVRLYKFEPGNKAVEATKNICIKSEDSWSQNSNQMVQEILLGLQETQQSNSSRPKTMDFKAVHFGDHQFFPDL